MKVYASKYPTNLCETNTCVEERGSGTGVGTGIGLKKKMVAETRQEGQCIELGVPALITYSSSQETANNTKHQQQDKTMEGSSPQDEESPQNSYYISTSRLRKKRRNTIKNDKGRNSISYKNMKK